MDMADKRISQLVDRGTVANNDVVPIVVSGATTTNKATISSIQTFMQGNLDLGVTSVGITLGSSGTDVSVSGSPITSSGNITINLPTASAVNRGALSSADWTTFNSKQQAITLTTTGTSGAATLVSGTLNIPNYSTDLSGYVTLGTTQTITAQKTFTTSGSSDTMIISHGSGSGFALDVLKAGNGEAIRVTKSSGSGNAMTISGGNFEAPTIVKTGGTSSQFLKADGSVDSSTYLTTDTNQSITGFKSFVNGFSLASEGGTNQATTLINTGSIHEGSAGINQIGFNNSNNIYFGKGLNNGGVIQWNNAAVRYYTLPDSDGTLAFTSQIPANPVGGTGAAGRVAYWNGAATITSDSLFQWNDTFRRLGIGCTPTVSLDVVGAGALTGALSVGGALNGTSASFTSENFINTSGHTTNRAYIRTANTGNTSYFGIESSTGGSIITGSNAYSTIIGNGSARDLQFATNDAVRLTLASTGAATFSSSVTATSFNLGNGQFLRLTRSSGALQYDALGIVAGTDNTRLISTGDFDIVNGALASQFKIASTGAATFSSSVTATQFITGGTPSNTAGFTNSFYAESNIPSLTLSNTGTNTGKYTLGVTNGNFGIWNNPTSSYRLFIDSTGNVGIGTASPGSQVAIEKSSNSGSGSTFPRLAIKNTLATQGDGSSTFNFADILVSSGNESVNMFLSTTFAAGSWAPAGIINVATNHDLQFKTNNLERMRITSGGTLKAKGTETTYHNINASYHELRTGAGGQFTAAISNTAGTPFGLLIDYNSAPNNSSSEFLYCTDGIVSTLRAKILSNGGLSNFQANNTNLSDERTKKDIEPLESYWDKFKAIEIVKFKYKDQTHDDFNIGVIAQQVEAVAPEFVDVDGWDTKPKLDEEGNEIVSEEEPLKSIYTADLYHATIKVLQEAMAKIEELQIQIDSLKNQIK